MRRFGSKQYTVSGFDEPNLSIGLVSQPHFNTHPVDTVLNITHYIAVINNPILVFGLPRSGTTWLGKLFDSHPDTLYRHEPDSRHPFNDLPRFISIDAVDAYRETVLGFVNDLPANGAPDVSASKPVFRKGYYSPWQWHLLRLTAGSTKLIRQIAPRFPLFGMPSVRDYPALRVVWKSVVSLGRLGVTARILNNATVFFLIRNPCGYIASILRGQDLGKFNVQVQSSEHFKVFEDLLECRPARLRSLTMEKIRALSTVERLAWRWVLFNEQCMEDLRDLSNAYVVRYEDLANSPQRTLQRLFESAGLGWHGQTEEYLLRSTRKHTTGYYNLVKDPGLSATSWRHELSTDDIARIASIVRDSCSGRLYVDELDSRS